MNNLKYVLPQYFIPPKRFQQFKRMMVEAILRQSLLSKALRRIKNCGRTSFAHLNYKKSKYVEMSFCIQFTILVDRFGWQF